MNLPLVSPALVLTFAIASLYGLLFFLIFDHGGWRLILDWGVAVVGFELGQWMARVVGLALFNIGEVNLVEGTVTCLLCLIAARAWKR